MLNYFSGSVGEGRLLTRCCQRPPILSWQREWNVQPFGQRDVQQDHRWRTTILGWQNYIVLWWNFSGTFLEVNDFFLKIFTSHPYTDTRTHTLDLPFSSCVIHLDLGEIFLPFPLLWKFIYTFFLYYLKFAEFSVYKLHDLTLQECLSTFSISLSQSE